VKIAIARLAILFALLVPLVSCERHAAASSEATALRDATGTDALLMAKSGSTLAAVSALNSLDSGDLKVARSTLEAQVVSGLAVLKGMQPEKTPVSAAMVDEAVAEAEAYLTKHNLAAPALPEKN
jgi:hypothetical protein